MSWILHFLNLENYSLCHLCLTSQAGWGAFYILGPFSFIVFNTLYQCPICTSVADAISVSPRDSRPSNSHSFFLGLREWQLAYRMCL